MSDMSLIHYVAAHSVELLEKTYQQCYLVGFSMLFAIVIGVPFGIGIAYFKRIRGPVLWFANILQTIPSLALLTFLLPVFGIGAKPAITALALYALLPIIRSTYTGIQSVPEASLNAARGLGFTRWQRMWLVELPLALPIIISGVRIATAISVGIATLAAFIGAGGLGDFINQGLALNNMRLVMLGAIPAAIMALVLDFMLGYIEKKLSMRRVAKPTRRRNIIMIMTCVLLIAFAGFAYSHWFTKHKTRIVVATKQFTEQFIIGQMISQLLAAKTNFDVVEKPNLGTTAIITQAMKRGEVDIYPEYTGTAYLLVLHKKKILTPKATYDFVKKAYAQRYGIQWLKPLGFDNTQALAVRQAFANAYQLKTISNLLPIESQLVIGAPPGFIGRPDGYIGLKRVYHLHFGAVREMYPSIIYKAIVHKKVNVAMVYTTDGRITADHLLVLKDNKHLFPPYDAAILVRKATLKAHPQIAKILAPLAGLITNKIMQTMNYDVDIKKQSPAYVAKEFLKQHHLI